MGGWSTAFLPLPKPHGRPSHRSQGNQKVWSLWQQWAGWGFQQWQKFPPKSELLPLLKSLAGQAWLEMGTKSHRDQEGGCMSLFSVVPCELRGERQVAGVLGRRRAWVPVQEEEEGAPGSHPAPTSPPVSPSLQGEITFRLPLKVQGAGGKDREGALPAAQSHFPRPPTSQEAPPPHCLAFCLGSWLTITQKGQ